MCACDDSVSRAEKFLQSIDRLKRDALIGCHPRHFCAQNNVLLGVRIAFVLRLTLDKQIGMCPQPNHIRCFTWSNLFLVKYFDLSLNWHRRTPHLLPIFLPNVSRGTLILSASLSPHFAINAPPRSISPLNHVRETILFHVEHCWDQCYLQCYIARKTYRQARRLNAIFSLKSTCYAIF